MGPHRPTLIVNAVRKQWPLLLVLAVTVTGLAIVADNHFRRGTVLFAFGICLGAVLRGVLPESRAGLLRVRSKTLDVLTLGGLGLITLVLALVVPRPS